MPLANCAIAIIIKPFRTDMPYIRSARRMMKLSPGVLTQSPTLSLMPIAAHAFGLSSEFVYNKIFRV